VSVVYLISRYLISRPGRPIHLAIWAHDAPSKEDFYATGRWVSLCGSDRGQRWTVTGQWAEKWPQHQRGGLCLHCEKRLNEIFASVDSLPLRGAR
jgi:hypothetical protein